MIWTLIILLVVLWALGYGVAGLGSLIHLLLIVALIMLIFQLVTGRRVP